MTLNENEFVDGAELLSFIQKKWKKILLISICSFIMGTLISELFLPKVYQNEIQLSSKLAYVDSYIDIFEGDYFSRDLLEETGIEVKNVKNIIDADREGVSNIITVFTNADTSNDAKLLAEAIITTIKTDDKYFFEESISVLENPKKESIKIRPTVLRNGFICGILAFFFSCYYYLIRYVLKLLKIKLKR